MRRPAPAGQRHPRLGLAWHAACSRVGGGPAPADRQRDGAVLDLVFTLATLAFFAIAWAYAVACDRL